jgi:hypothetical protein
MKKIEIDIYIHYVVLGYSDFDFFWQNGASQTRQECKKMGF